MFACMCECNELVYIGGGIKTIESVRYGIMGACTRECVFNVCKTMNRQHEIKQ